MNPARRYFSALSILLLLPLTGCEEKRIPPVAEATPPAVETEIAVVEEVPVVAEATPAATKTEPATEAKPAEVITKVDVEAFDKLRADPANQILDVRTEEEFEAGHISGAVNIDFTEPDFEQKVALLDKSKPYLVYCAVGGRSAKASKKMEAAGFVTVYDLSTGFTSWEAAGKPVEK